ncbi:CAP domain-containing protein, partial [Streptomyces sp. EN23]|uniref:CAP domain-containing protein n=1 Tax=Streptomyces sp. EN23 TaxID=212774 RepID=UPI000B123791
QHPARRERLRAANGCPELETDPRLTEVAQRHSEDMAARNYFGHTDSSGRGAGDRVGATGYDWSAVGETIATGMSDPAAVVEEWRNSPGPDARVVTRVNTLRAANGCPELETDPRLTEVAQRHSEDMAARNYFGHTDSSGRGAGDRVGATGYDWSAVGETIATGMSDPAAVVEE